MRRTWSNLILVLSAAFILTLSRSLITPILPLYLSFVGLSTLDVGISFAAFGIGTLIFEPSVGLMADKGKRESMMLAFIVGACVIFLVFTDTKSFLVVSLLQLLLGGIFAGATVLFRYAVPEIAEHLKRSTAFGVLGSIYSASGALGALIGGLLSSLFGYASSFYFAAAFAIVAIVPLVSVRVDKLTVRVNKIEETTRSTVSKVTAELIIMGMMAMAAFITFAIYLSMIPLVLIQSPFRSNAAGVGTVIALLDGTIFFFYILMGKMGGVRPRLWIGIGLIVGALSFATMMFAQSFWMVYLGTFLAGVSFSTIATLSLTEFTTLVPKSRRGAAIGFYGAAEDIGMIIGPILFSAVWSAISLHAAFFSVAIVQLFILITYGAFHRLRGQSHL